MESEVKVIPDSEPEVVDEHQNNVWNIHLGLTNFGHLKYM